MTPYVTTTIWSKPVSALPTRSSFRTYFGLVAALRERRSRFGHVSDSAMLDRRYKALHNDS